MNGWFMKYLCCIEWQAWKTNCWSEALEVICYEYYVACMHVYTHRK